MQRKGPAQSDTSSDSSDDEYVQEIFHKFETKEKKPKTRPRSNSIVDPPAGTSGNDGSPRTKKSISGLLERNEKSQQRRKFFAEQATSTEPLFDFKPQKITSVKPPRQEPIVTPKSPARNKERSEGRYDDTKLSPKMIKLIESGFKRNKPPVSPRKPPQSPQRNKESYALACERNERIIEGVIGDRKELNDRAFVRVMMRFEMSDKELLDKIREATGSNSAALKTLLTNAANNNNPNELEMEIRHFVVGAIANMKSTVLSPKKRPKKCEGENQK